MNILIINKKKSSLIAQIWTCLLNATYSGATHSLCPNAMKCLIVLLLCNFYILYFCICI